MPFSDAELQVVQIGRKTQPPEQRDVSRKKIVRTQWTKIIGALRQVSVRLHTRKEEAKTQIQKGPGPYSQRPPPPKHQNLWSCVVFPKVRFEVHCLKGRQLERVSLGTNLASHPHHVPRGKGCAERAALGASEGSRGMEGTSCRMGTLRKEQYVRVGNFEL